MSGPVPCHPRSHTKNKWQNETGSVEGLARRTQWKSTVPLIFPRIVPDTEYFIAGQCAEPHATHR